MNRLLQGDVVEGFAVVAAGTPNMTVIVQPGSGRISTGSYPASYGYLVSHDTVASGGEIVTVPTAAANPRIDYVVGYVDKSVAGSTSPSNVNNTNNIFKFVDVPGTPAASPVVPTTSQIQSQIGAANPYFILASVYVDANVSQIVSGKISDLRIMAGARQLPSGYAQITAPFTASGSPDQDVTNLVVPMNVPSGGRRIKATLYCPQVYGTIDGGRIDLGIQEDGVDIGRNYNRTWTQANNGNGGQSCIASKVATAGIHTYKVRISGANNSSVGTIFAATNTPAFLLVEFV